MEQCNLWGLITQSFHKNNNNSADLDDVHSSSNSYGALVGNTLESCCVILRNIMCLIVGADENASKEDVQAVLEAIYRSHIIDRLLEACKMYGANISGKCVAALVNVLSELVLSSSKFLAQVRRLVLYLFLEYYY